MLNSNRQLEAKRWMRGQRWFDLAGLCLLGIASTWIVRESVQAQPEKPDLKGYEELAKPFIKQHCLSCHGAEKAKAGL